MNKQGIREAERQIRVARRLYAASGADRPWLYLTKEERRPYIDLACRDGNELDHGYGEHDPTLDFVALDFETANPDLTSVCQVGIVEFKAGEEVDSFISLVNPEDYFDGVNVSIHGIREEDVAGAPVFQAIYPELAERLSDKVVVSHMPFDRTVLSRSLTKHYLPPITCRWLDSARVVRRTWPEYTRRGYALSTITAELGFRFQHHNALEDARAAGLVLLRAIGDSGLCLEEWLTRSLLCIGSNGTNQGIKRDGNPNGPLFGETIVFTGALSLPRREAADIAARLGCSVRDSVTKRTTMLVIGDQDLRRLAPGTMQSSKRSKVDVLLAAGVPIRIISESDFVALGIIESNPASEAERRPKGDL